MVTNEPERAVMVSEALALALDYVKRSGLSTFDPNDIRATRPIVWSYQKRTLLRRLVRQAIYASVFIAPIGTRRMFGIKPTVTPHGVAALACAYNELSYFSSDYLTRSKELLDWLSENVNDESIGKGWGFPFNWPSFVVVPKGTGISHTTMWVGNAFFSYFERTRDLWALNMALESCEFLINGLNRTTFPTGGIALSYTALDSSTVINTNADIASLLLRVGIASSRSDLVELSGALLKFVIENQNPDGSWFYDANTKSSSKIDGYHTGMIIKALAEVVELLPENHQERQVYKSALVKGVRFYLEHLFGSDGSPVYVLGRKYPVDIYSCGQAIDTLSHLTALATLEPEEKQKVQKVLVKVVDLTLSTMLDPDGSFVYRRYPLRKLRLRSLRWGQAFMCLVLARYQKILHQRLSDVELLADKETTQDQVGGRR